MCERLMFSLPVSINKMYQPAGHAIILSQAARNWKEYAMLLARSQWQDAPLEGELVVFYYFYGSKMDWDNPCKILGDALNGIVWIDDSQVVEAHIYLSRDKTNDRRVEVEVMKKQGKTI